jgi:hypothetical protein
MKHFQTWTVQTKQGKVIQSKFASVIQSDISLGISLSFNDFEDPSKVYAEKNIGLGSYLSAHKFMPIFDNLFFYAEQNFENAKKTPYLGVFAFVLSCKLDYFPRYFCLFT